MLLSYLKRLCITSATLIAASPRATLVPRAASLPSALQEKVPTCAQSCLRTSLVDKFPVACLGQDSITCLCSRYSNSGESLGEVALGCVYSSCSTMDSAALAAYNVCLGQNDAVRGSKTALTVAPTSTARSTSTISSSKLVSTPLVTTTSQTQTMVSQSALADSVSSLPSATMTPSITSTPLSVAADDAPPKMTPAQIAGLSVAAVAALAVAVALMAVSVCLRRRREKKNGYDSDEKGAARTSRKPPGRVSRFVPVGSQPEPPARFPMAPPQAARKGGRYPDKYLNPNVQPDTRPGIRPVQHDGVGTFNGTSISSSDSSLPLSQIGVAISAELDGTAISRMPTVRAPHRQQKNPQPKRESLLRPISSMTTVTVFEEDETSARRRSSILLPTPPVPVAPIRSLQPSRQPAGNTNPFPPRKDSRRGVRSSELFLDIPVRHGRPQPQMLAHNTKPSRTPSKSRQPQNTNQLAPPVQTIASASPGSAGDIDEYYFTSQKQPALRASPTYLTQARSSSKTVQIKPKTSQSTVSRASSRASTNIRDSLSSQTSFETVDPNDSTPEDEDDDKQLSSSDDNKLSPVAESPISNLKYPKIPRSSNQLVPRSPRSPRSAQSFKNLRTPQAQTSASVSNKPSPSPRPTPSPSVILQHRAKALDPPLLETRQMLKLNASKDIAMVGREGPLLDPFTSPPRNPRAKGHIRSASTEPWSTTPRSKTGNIERKSRTQSGMWARSPAMFDTPSFSPEIVKPQPLNVRRKGPQDKELSIGSVATASIPLSARCRRDEMKETNVGRYIDVEFMGEEGLKSPVWVPRLTPTRKGDDLFISVGWGGKM